MRTRMASVESFGRSLEQLLYRFDVAKVERLAAIFPAIEGAAHFLRKLFRKRKSQNHPVVCLVVQEEMQIAFEGIAEFLHGKFVFRLAVFDHPKLKDADRFAFHITMSDRVL